MPLSDSPMTFIRPYVLVSRWTPVIQTKQKTPGIEYFKRRMLLLVVTNSNNPNMFCNNMFRANAKSYSWSLLRFSIEKTLFTTASLAANIYRVPNIW